MVDTTLEDDRRPTNGHSPRIERLTIAEMPPHDANAELGLLAAEIYNPGTFAELGVTRGDFYTGTGCEIFDALEAMRLAQAPISFDTLRHFLKALPDDAWGMIGSEGIISEIESVTSAATCAKYYFDLVRKAAILRAVREQALAVAGIAGDPNASLATIFERADFSSLRPVSQSGFEWLTAADLDSRDFRQEYLIPGILAAGQPGGIYGAFKSLKTSMAMDLFLSLAMGHPFLDCFPIPAPVPVAFMSGESAMADLKSIAQRICGARGRSLDRVEGFHLSPMLPRLDDSGHMREIERFIIDRGVRAFGVDPAYLCMDLADDAHNLFAVGKYLKPIAELCQATGCAFLIIHHNKRGVPDPFAPAELSDVAWSGFAEFSAQWLLLSRRSPFDPETGRHAIWLNCGGRAGHCGVYGIDIDEGRFDDDGGRVWKVNVHLASEARARALKERGRKLDEDRERKQSLNSGKDRQAVLRALKRFQNGETARIVREAARMSGTRFTPAIAELGDDGLVESCDVAKSKGTYAGFRITPGWWDKVRLDGTIPPVPVSDEDGGTRDSYRESQSHPIIINPGRDSNARKSVPPSGGLKDWDEF